MLSNYTKRIRAGRKHPVQRILVTQVMLIQIEVNLQCKIFEFFSKCQNVVLGKAEKSAPQRQSSPHPSDSLEGVFSRTRGQICCNVKQNVKWGCFVASLHTWKHLPRNKICDLGHIRKCYRLRFQAITTLSLCGDGVFVCGGSGVFGVWVEGGDDK